MKLIEAIRDLDSLDRLGVLYATEPWTDGSETVIVTMQPDSPEVLPDASVRARGFSYFLGVLEAREVVEGWRQHLDVEPTLEQRCARLIQYAVMDA